MTEYRKGKKRVTLDIPTEIYNQFKEVVKFKNTDMTKYILYNLIQCVAKDTQYMQKEANEEM